MLEYCMTLVCCLISNIMPLLNMFMCADIHSYSHKTKHIYNDIGPECHIPGCVGVSEQL